MKLFDNKELDLLKKAGINNDYNNILNKLV